MDPKPIDWKRRTTFWRGAERRQNRWLSGGGIHRSKSWIEMNAGEGDRQGGVMLFDSVPGHHF
jgi:hypothetical protein